MATPNSIANVMPELATDLFEEWCAINANVLAIQPRSSLTLSAESRKFIPSNIRSSLDTSVPAIESSLFPYLPTELRLEIWQNVHTGPRVIYLKGSGKTRQVFPPQRAPSKLHACRESREEALKQLQPVFRRIASDGRQSPVIYVNPAIDIFHVRSITANETFNLRWGLWDMFSEFARASTLAPVKFLSLDLRTLTEQCFGERACLAWMSLFYFFPKLETLVIGVQTQDLEDSSPMTFFDLIDPTVATQIPTDTVRFRTHPTLNSEIDKALGFRADGRGVTAQGFTYGERRALLQELLDKMNEKLLEVAKFHMRMFLFGHRDFPRRSGPWDQLPKVEIKVLTRNQDE